MPIVIVQTYPSASHTIWPIIRPKGNGFTSMTPALHRTFPIPPSAHGNGSSMGGANASQERECRRFGAGEHTVRLTVTDADGISNSTTRSFTVTEAVPSAASRASVNRVGSLSYFNSTSGYAWTPIVSYRWTFGDGGSTDGTGRS